MSTFIKAGESETKDGLEIDETRSPQQGLPRRRRERHCNRRAMLSCTDSGKAVTLMSHTALRGLRKGSYGGKRGE